MTTSLLTAEMHHVFEIIVDVVWSGRDYVIDITDLTDRTALTDLPNLTDFSDLADLTDLTDLRHPPRD